MSSSSSAKHSTNANNRKDHNQGKHDREYTPAQIAAVNRVRKCRVSDYYAILDVEKPSNEAEIRKAYRKLALVMHPDKNSAPGADEAFKMVSKAFQILSDADKKRIYDQTGSDPDSRSPGPSFSRASTAGHGPQAHFQGDISPEDLFNMFFGGGGLGGDSPFQQFGGAGFGPNVRFQTFGGGSPFSAAFGGGGPGANPRQRQRQRQEQEEPFSLRNLAQLLPLLMVIVLPMLFNGLFSDSTQPTKFQFQPSSRFSMERETPNHHVPFYVKPRDVTSMSPRDLKRLDHKAEVYYIRMMTDKCSREYEYKQQKVADSQGWFFTDEAAYERAMAVPLPSCDLLDDMGVSYNRGY